MKRNRLIVLCLIVLASASAFAQSPVIVAQVTLLNQFGKIAPATLLNPTTNGVYRITGYMTVLPTDKKPLGKWDPSIVWDDETNIFQTFSWEVNPTQRTGQGVIVVRTLAGRPIVYYVNGGSATNFNYDLFITVEQLETD
ncbi:MAG TPA: hypothetical protein VFA68_07475 [Terriglobales bacterium]|nr:hypothetical protein [Terriglobales bacterium]